MSGPFSSPIDPDFIRELVGGPRSKQPTSAEAARATALVGTNPRPDRQARALWTLAQYLHGGGLVDAPSLGHANRILLGGMVLVLQAIDGPRGASRTALVGALHANDPALLNQWILDTTSAMRRDREAQNAG